MAGHPNKRIMTMQKLEAHEQAIHKIFSSDYSFRIPDYQRPYAWEVEQATQLLEDLAEAMERDGEEPYFLGSVVLVKAPNQALAEVIDGQQRLTTLTILLAVLRDLTDNQVLRDDLDGMLCERGNLIKGLGKEPRLTLRDRDADFFREYVQEPGRLRELLALEPEQLDTGAKVAIQTNAAALWKDLSAWDEEQRFQLAQMIGTNTFLVVVSTPDLDSAHRIFSVMNARGLDLSPTDIFKSKVIGHLAENESAIYTRKWEDAEESLGRDGFVELFLHLRTILTKKRARRELLKEFTQDVLDLYLPDRAAEFVDDLLVPYAEAYQDLGGNSYVATEHADQVNAWLRRLSQLDNNDWKPVALWALRERRHDPSWLAEFLRRLERLAASMLIRRVYTTPRIERYLDLLRQLDSGDDLGAAALDLSDDERHDTLTRLDGEIYLVARVRRYVLLRLDETLAGDPGATYSHPRITVEHVLPQNPAPSSEWRELFGKADRDRWTHRLANLVLLNRVKNSAAGRLPFAEKKKKYFTGPNGVAAFAITTQVLTEECWTPEVLERRQAELIGALRQEWRL